jgi:hypothetical protein
MSVPICYYGSPEPLPAVWQLRAGPLSLTYEAGDFRYVRLGEREVLRRVYVAVRDRNWGTVPAKRSNEQIETKDDGFYICYDAEHRQGDIHFLWHARITGASDGTVIFTMTGEALSTFQKNRIGFCVLHPIRECAGAKCRLEQGDGAREKSKFPFFIAPQNPYTDLRAISHEISPGLWAELCFEGDLFETEDQRNWIDASFKTFCTPLRLPFPVTVEAGTPICQTVTLRLRGEISELPSTDSPATFILGTQPLGSMPQLGLSGQNDRVSYTRQEVERLRLLRPAHLRAELDLNSRLGSVEDRLRWATEEAEQLGIPLELAITLSDAIEDESTKLLASLHAVNPPLRRVLLFHNRSWTTPEHILKSGCEAIARYDASVPVYAGTTANFAELNRARPRGDGISGICYSIQPQEHAFDDSSLIECCAAIEDTVRSARQFCGKLPIAVTPITLRKRVNPYATGPALPVSPNELLPTVDPRQMSLFGAGWTLAALKYLAESGVASATFFETTGWRGVMECALGCSLPDKFPSKPGMIYPLYHVLADAAEFTEAEVLPSLSSHPLRFDGLALRRGKTIQVMLANLTDQPQAIVICGIPREAIARALDEGTYERATTTDPLGFRKNPVAPCTSRDGTLKIPLRPYSYVRIDCC